MEADAYVLAGELVVEEKLDGANLGLSLAPDGRLRAQNRGQYLYEPHAGQFARLPAWLAQHESGLRGVLSPELILFGEWCALTHSIAYTALPDWFVGFYIFSALFGAVMTPALLMVFLKPLYRSVLAETEALFDYQLRQMALSLRDQGEVAPAMLAQIAALRRKREAGLDGVVCSGREIKSVHDRWKDGFHVVPGLVILTVAGLVMGWTPDPVGLAAGLLGFAIVGTWGTAVALLFSAANVFFRDFGNIVSTLTIFVTFSCPMIYPYSIVGERFGPAAQYYLLNPVAEAVLLNQRFFWVGTTPDPEATIAEHMPDHLFQALIETLAQPLALQRVFAD